MALVTLKTLLDDAKRNKYGVGAFNVVDFEMILSLIQAAEETNKPIIIQYAEGDDSRIPIEDIGLYATYLINKSKVPICLHLDHGKSFSAIMRAIKAGFSSVMIDASHLPYEENVKFTQEVVRVAHSLGVSVEAEIGRMINSEYEEHIEEEGLSLEETFTKPDLAASFAKETNADAIAVSFGTIHGVYAEKPKLNFSLLSDIAKVVEQPLVVHGGSGLADEEYKKMIDLGISKINFYSEMSYAVTNRLLAEVTTRLDNGKKQFLQDLVDLEKQYVTEEISKKIQVFSN
ncbi:class II fructose-bisphosphate aldolase [Enterococcus sp. LJL90]